MASAIDAVPQPDSASVQLTLSGWSAGTASVPLTRVVRGVRSEVRGSPVALAAGGAVVVDHEAPVGSPVEYEAPDGAVTVRSAAVTVESAEAWLRVPGRPDLARTCTPERVPTFQRQRLTTILQPLGSSVPLAISGPLLAATGSVTLLAWDDAEVEALLEALRASTVVLLSMPGTHWHDRYIAVQSVKLSPFTGFSTDASWKLTCAVAEATPPA